MSVGNMYNYFKSKDVLAKEIISFISQYLGDKLKEINEQNISTNYLLKSLL
jgi:AcrR family transcriptional regulator